MTGELHTAFAVQIDLWEREVASLRVALDQEEDPENAAILREKIAGLETLIAKVRAIEVEIFNIEANAEHDAKRFAEWRKTVVEFRGLAAKRDELAGKLPVLREIFEAALERMQFALGLLANHKGKKFGPLTLESEKRHHGKITAELQRDYDTRRSEYLVAQRKLGETQSAALTLDARVNELTWRASQLAPPSLLRPEPEKNFAVVSIG